MLTLKRFLVTIVIGFITSSLYAQKLVFVDFNEVKKQTEKTSSPYHYPKLVARLIALDSTLTEKDMYYLYYGSSLNKKEITPSPLPDNVKKLLDKDDLTQPEKKEILDYYEQAFKKNPMGSVSGIRNLVIWYGENNKTAEETKVSAIYGNLLDAIFSTGSGQDIESAIDVVMVNDEYTLARVLKLKSKGQSLLHEEGRSYDVLNCTDRNGDEIKLYFDVTRLFEVYDEMFKDKIKTPK